MTTQAPYATRGGEGCSGKRTNNECQATACGKEMEMPGPLKTWDENHWMYLSLFLHQWKKMEENSRNSKAKLKTRNPSNHQSFTNPNFFDFVFCSFFRTLHSAFSSMSMKMTKRVLCEIQNNEWPVPTSEISPCVPFVSPQRSLDLIKVERWTLTVI